MVKIADELERTGTLAQQFAIALEEETTAAFTTDFRVVHPRPQEIGGYAYALIPGDTEDDKTIKLAMRFNVKENLKVALIGLDGVKLTEENFQVFCTKLESEGLKTLNDKNIPLREIARLAQKYGQPAIAVIQPSWEGISFTTSPSKSNRYILPTAVAAAM